MIYGLTVYINTAVCAFSHLKKKLSAVGSNQIFLWGIAILAAPIAQGIVTSF